MYIFLEKVYPKGAFLVENSKSEYKFQIVNGRISLESWTKYLEQIKEIQ